MSARESDLLPYQLLDQIEIWVDRFGKVHQLEEMNIHHRAMLIPFLRRQAQCLQDQAWRRYMRGLGAVSDPSDGVWLAQMDADREYELPAMEWLERQPLMIRLLELDQRNAMQRQVTKVRNRLYPLRRRLGMAK